MHTANRDSEKIETPQAELTAANAGNFAQVITVANQTINLGSRPEWIQSLTLEQLAEAEKRLYRASIRHENRSVVPLMAPFLVMLLVGALFTTYINAVGHEPTRADRIFFGVMALMLAFPTWLIVYDIRRRNREVVRAAERRWAEITVEMAVRTEIVPRYPGKEWWNRVSARLRRSPAKNDDT